MIVPFRRGSTNETRTICARKSVNRRWGCGFRSSVSGTWCVVVRGGVVEDVADDGEVLRWRPGLQVMVQCAAVAVVDGPGDLVVAGCPSHLAFVVAVVDDVPFIDFDAVPVVHSDVLDDRVRVDGGPEVGPTGISDSRGTPVGAGFALELDLSHRISRPGCWGWRDERSARPVGLGRLVRRVVVRRFVSAQWRADRGSRQSVPLTASNLRTPPRPDLNDNRTVGEECRRTGRPWWWFGPLRPVADALAAVAPPRYVSLGARRRLREETIRSTFSSIPGTVVARPAIGRADECCRLSAQGAGWWGRHVRGDVSTEPGGDPGGSVVRHEESVVAVGEASGEQRGPCVQRAASCRDDRGGPDIGPGQALSLIHISEPTRRT